MSIDQYKAKITERVGSNGMRGITGEELKEVFMAGADAMQEVQEETKAGFNLGFLTPASAAAPATGIHRGHAVEPGTYTNFKDSGNAAIVVTAADLDEVNGVANNRVILEVNNGVATKRVERVKGDVGVVNYNTGPLSPTSIDKAETGKSVADYVKLVEGRLIYNVPLEVGGIVSGTGALTTAVSRARTIPIYFDTSRSGTNIPIEYPIGLDLLGISAFLGGTYVRQISLVTPLYDGTFDNIIITFKRPDSGVITDEDLKKKVKVGITANMIDSVVTHSVNDINISAKYPTGGSGGTAFYTLSEALSKLGNMSIELGNVITFRESTNIVKRYLLQGIAVGSYPVYHLNPDNWTELNKNSSSNIYSGVTNVNEINVSSLYPTGGTNGGIYYTLEGAIGKLSADVAKIGLKLTFRTSSTSVVTYKLEGVLNGSYPSYYLNPANWVKQVSSEKLFDDFYNSTENRLANPLFESLETWNIKNPTNTITAVNVMATGGGNGYRIPTTIITNAGTYLVATELRPIGSPGDYGDFGIELARKTTGGSFVNTVVLPYNSFGKGRFMDPSFVIDRTGAHGTAGRIYLFVGSFTITDVWRNNTTESSDYFYITSDDDGLTWSSPTSVKSKWDLTKYKLAMPAPSNGIQLTDGSFVIPSFCTTGVGSSSLILKKRVGEDWFFSEIVTADGVATIDECTVVERSANEVILIGRLNANYGNKANKTDLIFKYNDAQNTWIKEESTFAINRSNQLSVDKAIINGKVIYLKSFTDSNTDTRVNITIWASLDLKKWIRVYRLYAPSGNGYSVVNYYNNKIICAYETTSGIGFQDITPIINLIENSALNFIEKNISVQDRMQMIINMIKGI